MAMAPPSLECMLVEVPEKSVAILKFNKPKLGNSMSENVMNDLHAALKWADAAPEVRIIILTGQGKFFSTGMHLDDKFDISKAAFGPTSNFRLLNRLLINSRKILIAGVNGPAAGYGVSILGLFDLVYAVPDAYFFTPFVKWGMAAEGASSFTFPRLMGHQKAAALFLAAERISAPEAEKLGLITKIVAKEGFLDTVLDSAREIAKAPPGSLKATKDLMRAPVRQHLLDANERECDVLQHDRITSDEPQKAIAEFRVAQERRRKGKSRL